MLLQKSVALSILVTLGVQGLLIPSLDVIEVFKNTKDIAPVAEGPAAVATEAIAGSDSISPLFKLDRDIIPHKYIVVLKENIDADAVAFHQEWVAEEHANSVASIDSSHSFFAATRDFKAEGGIVDTFKIENLFSGYSGFFLESTIDLIRKHPYVKYVEQDSLVHATEFDIQKGAPWGLARVSHRQPLSLNSFNQYLHDTEGGKGVTAYVIDTGINVDHVEFAGRAKWGSTIPTGDADIDGNGHGTHCAGTIASDSYGVAKKAEVVAVKVLRSNGSGSMSDVVKGVEFAAKSHLEAAKNGKKGFKGSTANMSLGGGKSPALDQVVDAAVNAGIHFAVAAGNENQDACNTSPASSEKAITVGASTISDARAYFSNYGKCVDIFGPGLNILSTYIGSETATATLSGTSMASPHIAGLLSYYLSLQPGAESEYFVSSKGVTPAQLKKNLIAFGTRDVLSDIPNDGTPNILAFNGAGHNLTEFWGESVAGQESVSSQKVSLDHKMDQLLHKFESTDIVKDIKDIVDEVYQELTN
ncbi:vacuolar protease B [Suhomyces tanzawaensis NRRL Y-17324]|uniref:Vacuolar protease B n=1 Tax=Suhomyces tanzawaensis NRRL Y-17324 TaxID=984487 RepID=A0A1E4SI41_9ASCO|nr:vacuolar protease B [Suhomyces tanzawaensis NRRL Y-17324]ODV79117.1 vacuolar protease B [Suhomyces tanzawaensis NRRL Y-17324]